MHVTSYLKMKSFVEVQFKQPISRPWRILDVGSKSYEGHAAYRSLFDGMDVEYLGLDLEPGPGVDLVPSHPFVWKELADEDFDAAVCGQVFEHNPMFWITFAEIARVLKPGGLTMVIAPGKGAVHRYPVDCWRFYPDAWHSLCAYTGMELVETFFEDRGNRRRERSLMWCDSCVIARKPILENPTARNDFYRRLECIAATAPPTFIAPQKSELVGPVFSHYLDSIEFGDAQRQSKTKSKSNPVSICFNWWKRSARGRRIGNTSTSPLPVLREKGRG